MANVESPRMLMRAMGSIWTATLRTMVFSNSARRESCGNLGDPKRSFQYHFPTGKQLWACVKCRRQMSRQMSGGNQHGIETQIGIGIAGIHHQPRFRGGDDPALLLRGDGTVSYTHLRA